jgi:hypothetical protein
MRIIEIGTVEASVALKRVEAREVSVLRDEVCLKKEVQWNTRTRKMIKRDNVQNGLQRVCVKEPAPSR